LRLEILLHRIAHILGDFPHEWREIASPLREPGKKRLHLFIVDGDLDHDLDFLCGWWL
jgi:hypothetical protein